MAVGPIQFSVSTNPIDGLNARLRAKGRKEIVTSVRFHPTDGYIDYDVCYVTGGKHRAQWVRRCPPDSFEIFVERFFTHLCDSEYQQYLDDHKAMTAVGGVFGENRFPRARERAFLDFRTVARSQESYQTFAYSDPHVGVIKKILDAYLTHHLPGLSSIKVELLIREENGLPILLLNSPSNLMHCKTIRVPMSQDMPWYTTAQQARGTLKEWIDAAAQKSAAQEKFGKGEIKINVPSDYATQQGTTKQETATASNDCIVSIWDINYPKARVEYRESLGALTSRFGFAQGIYKAGAKVSGIPRTEEPFDITLKYVKGNTVVLRNCTWIADGEVQCERIETNGKSALMPSEPIAQKAAAKQQIPKGAMVNYDGEVVGKTTPARGTAYLNGVPVGVMTNIEYGDATVRLNTDGEGRVTTTAQQARDEIDRGFKQATIVPTKAEIKQNYVEALAMQGLPCPTGGSTDSIANVMAASTHETLKAVAEDARRGFEQSRMGFDNLFVGRPLTRENLERAIDSVRSKITRVDVDKDGNPVVSLETTLPWPPEKVNIPVDFSVQIGDDVPKENLSMPDNIAPIAPVPTLKARAKQEAVEVAYRTAAIKLPDLARKQLVKRMAAKGGKRPSQARLSLAEDMLSGDEGSLIVAGILSLALSASPDFIKSKMPWLDLDRLAKELRLNVETRIACAVADMLGMYLDGALDALKEAFGGSQQLLLAEGGASDESALFNGVPKAESVGVR